MNMNAFDSRQCRTNDTHFFFLLACFSLSFHFIFIPIVCRYVRLFCQFFYLWKSSFGCFTRGWIGGETIQFIQHLNRTNRTVNLDKMKFNTVHKYINTPTTRQVDSWAKSKRKEVINRTEMIKLKLKSSWKNRRKKSFH